MSYGRYENQADYGQPNPYGQPAANPYAQDTGNRYAPPAGNPYAQETGNRYAPPAGNPHVQESGSTFPQQAPPQSGYGGRTQQQAPYDSRYGQRQNMGNGGYVGGNDMEMTPMNGQAGRDPNAILNECRDVDRGIDSIERNLERLRFLQQRALDDPDASQGTQTNRELDTLSSETMTLYRNFAARIKGIKQQRESGDPRNAPQVGKVDRKLKTAINQYQQVERDFRRKLQAQMERQYRIVRPDASDAEVREACEDASNNQVFSQALLQSDRRGQSQSALRAVQGRHEAIQKIESQMIELAQLFQDMEALVVQQEPAVIQIEQKGEEVTDNVGKANVEMDGAISKARSRNRKKWWCLLILLILVIIIVVAVVVAVLVTRRTAKTVTP